MKSRIFLIIFFSFVVLGPLRADALTDHVINRVPTAQKVVALTFDADMTPRMRHELQNHRVAQWYNKKLIDELIAEKVHATLFLTGMWVEAYPTTTQELSSNSLFEIGNHSYSHPAFSVPCYKLTQIHESDDAFEIRTSDELLSKYTTHYSKIFRFPGLCYDTDDLKAVQGAGYVVIGGDVLGGDGFQTRADKIVSNVLRNVRPGSIIVLHMMGGPNAPKTAEAVHTIITTLKQEGYEFVTITDLLKLQQKG